MYCPGLFTAVISELEDLQNSKRKIADDNRQKQEQRIFLDRAQEDEKDGQDFETLWREHNEKMRQEESRRIEENSVRKDNYIREDRARDKTQHV